VRPVPDSKTARRTTPGAAKAPETAVPLSPLPPDPNGHRPPRPIGPEALRALREAIRNGTYPSDAAVMAGLERLIRRGE
jgi:hypothetical protein